MKNKKQIVTYLMVGMIIIVPAISIAFAYLEAPSRLELAEKAYKQADDQAAYWSAQKKERRCDLAAVKTAEHEVLGLPGEEVARLGAILAECEGK